MEYVKEEMRMDKRSYPTQSKERKREENNLNILVIGSWVGKLATLLRRNRKIWKK